MSTVNRIRPSLGFTKLPAAELLLRVSAIQAAMDGDPAFSDPPVAPEVVKAAIDAYARSGRMLAAALAYAEHGFPIFPLSKHTKAPIPKADKDTHGKKIVRTGGFYKATTDPVIIDQWWCRNEHLIGMPMGPASSVFAIDIDTAEDHADGIAEWVKITAEHGEIDTREHVTATGGRHLILKYDDDQPIGCSRGSLPDGIDVKGRGGYIVTVAA
jgi:putative DNA primase/helicase